MSKTARSILKPVAATAAASPLLISESKKKYKAARTALKHEIQPRGIIEKMYVADITHLHWEIERLRRAKTAILNTAFREALVTILTQLLTRPGVDDDVEEKAEALADQWFSDAAAKTRVATLLAKYQLDATAIEGQVIKDCSAELMALDRLLSSAELRRQKALRLLAEYRAVLSLHVTDAREPLPERPATLPPARRPLLALTRNIKKKPSEAA